MPDWNRYVRRRLSVLPLAEERAEEIAREVADHLRSTCREALQAGISKEDAERAARRSVDWRLLECELQKVEGATQLELLRSSLLQRPAAPATGEGAGVVETVLRDLSYGLRSLVRNPALTSMVTLTLALGIGANTTIFTVVNGVLLSPLAYPDASRLVRVWPEKVFSVQMLQDLRERTSSFEQLSAYRQTDLTLLAGADTRVVQGAVVQVDYFSVLGAAPLLGRTFEKTDEVAGSENVIVLSRQLWQSAFGSDPAVVGQLVDLGALGYSQRRVIGVMPAHFSPLVEGTLAWIPLPADPDSPAFQGGYGYWAVARLASGISAAEASAEVGRLAGEFTELHPTQFRQARFSPVDVVPLLSSIVGPVRPTLLILLGSVALILLIACSNVANLLLARTSARSQEIAVRVALGAGRSALVRQFLTESLLMGLLGGAGGVAVGVVTIALVRDTLAVYLPRAPEIHFDWTVFAFTTLVSLLSALLFGSIPAWHSARSDPGASLSDGGRGASFGRRRTRLNHALVVLEVGLAVVLVIAASLLVKSFWRLHQVETGFDSDEVVTVELRLPSGRMDEPPARRAYFEALFDRLRALPGVESVGAINRLPMTPGNIGIPYLVEGRELPEGTASLVGNIRAVTPDYFRVLGIPLIEGRMLDASDSEAAEPVVLVNQVMAKLHWPTGDAVGNRFLAVGDREPLFRVVGVVSDVRQHQLSLEPEPEFYLPADQANWELSFVLVRTGWNPGAIAAECRRLAAALDPEVPVVEVTQMHEVIAASLGDPRFYTRLFGAFAVLALTLAVIGVYGVISYSLRQRTREIGLRMALGATRRDVLRMAMGRALLPVGAGVALGTALAVGLTRFLSAMLFEVQPTDPAVFGAVAAALVGVGIASSYLPIRRAARIDPVVALREQ